MMALPASIVSGQSNAPAYSSRLQQGAIFGNETNNMRMNNIDSAIESQISKKTLKSILFPSDLPKYHFNIVENTWNTRLGAASLTAEKIFKLPFPRELTDRHEVNYDANFNYLWFLENAAEYISKAIAKPTGLTVNTFKSVTLQIPDYKTHQLSWTLAPKNHTEALNIQRIIFSLKKGMTPRAGGGFEMFKNSVFGKFVLKFPQIYNLYFSPNPQWLFKFKPCVLTSIAVDYTGGSGVPAFYTDNSAIKASDMEPMTSADANGFHKGNNPPESVTIQTSWLELEYWVSGDFVASPVITDFPSSDPLDSSSWYVQGEVSNLSDRIGWPTSNVR